MSTVAVRVRLRVGGKFLLTVGVLVAAVLTVVGVGVHGLRAMSARSDALYDHGLSVGAHAADVVADALTVHETALYQVAADDPRLDAQLTDELDLVLLPQLTGAIAVLRADYAGQPETQREVDGLTAALQAWLDLRATGAYETPAETPADRTALATRTDELLEPLVDATQALRRQGAVQSAAVKARSDATSRSTLLLLVGSGLAVLLLGLGLVLVLIRDMVPRIRQYSRFAADIAAGHPAAALSPEGHDELTELGAALNDMVAQRRRADDQDAQRRALLERDDRAQAEFVDTLQVTRSEEEAQQLLQHHLQRSLPGTDVAVLRQNNSANRLEAVTDLPPDSPLPGRLVGAEPRSCVALRLGRTHSAGGDSLPLLPCTLCEHGARPSVCEPLLVGGEVIGSVLVSSEDELAPVAEARVKSAVSQAAPVLANLRSLALAEFRANNDALTGLPNKRATEDTLKRMVAQANRSLVPLSAVMLDLDHFKQINDRYGHACGDEVLAAVGEAISGGLRAGDVAGRIGGEEFLLLLPATDVEGARTLAEKVRRAISAITVPGVDREISASLGVAGLLEHAGNAAGLLHEADKAQYAAKTAGRNRTVVAGPDLAERTPA